jgi:uncharacterized membrane protein YqaE (UPF0057 family)
MPKLHRGNACPVRAFWTYFYFIFYPFVGIFLELDLDGFGIILNIFLCFSMKPYQNDIVLLYYI